jgi:hypothetical protein
MRASVKTQHELDFKRGYINALPSIRRTIGDSILLMVWLSDLGLTRVQFGYFYGERPGFCGYNQLRLGRAIATDDIGRIYEDCRLCDCGGSYPVFSRPFG